MGGGVAIFEDDFQIGNAASGKAAQPSQIEKQSAIQGIQENQFTFQLNNP
jgi:hypothetical protein